MSLPSIMPTTWSRPHVRDAPVIPPYITRKRPSEKRLALIFRHPQCTVKVSNWPEDIAVSWYFGYPENENRGLFYWKSGEKRPVEMEGDVAPIECEGDVIT